MIDLFGNEPLRMLGWKQPFASLMLYGKIETRTWDTAYRGKVLLYATLQPFTLEELYPFCSDSLIEKIYNKIQHDPAKDFLGLAFATGYLVHTRKMKPADEDQCFVNYDEKRYCHIYKNVQRIAPFALKGSQGFVSLYPHRKEHLKIIDQIKLVAA
jgi:hypothetical protein